jgi:hypothetical protein
MKEIEKKDTPEISGGEVMSRLPVLDVSYPLVQLPVEPQRIDTQIAPEQTPR